jgi:hypothetical protein
MATTEKPDVARAALALAGSYRRQIAQAHSRAYRRAVRSFSKDAGCTEAQAKEWLASIGVTEPSVPNSNGKK